MSNLRAVQSSSKSVKKNLPNVQNKGKGVKGVLNNVQKTVDLLKRYVPYAKGSLHVFGQWHWHIDFLTPFPPFV